MVENRIKEIREQKGITQQELSNQVNCTKKYIQRIEGAHEAVKFGMALKISAALESDLVEVFPKAKETVQKAIKKNWRIEDLYRNSELRQGMESAGIDMFPGVHYFKYQLRGGTTGIYEITSQERDRLQMNFQNSDKDNTPFVAFYSGEFCVLVNFRHLIFGHFLFDFTASREESAPAVEIFFADGSNPVVLEVDEDELDAAEPETTGQVACIVFQAETWVEKNDFFSLIDADLEIAFFRAEDVAMMKIPLWTFNPDIEPSDYDELESL